MFPIASPFGFPPIFSTQKSRVLLNILGSGLTLILAAVLSLFSFAVVKTTLTQSYGRTANTFFLNLKSANQLYSSSRKPDHL